MNNETTPAAKVAENSPTPDENTKRLNEEFEPKPIGDSDYRRFNAINSSYEKLTKSANNLKTQLEECLCKKYGVEQFIEFTKSNAKGWVAREYIKNNNIEFPGMDTLKLIDLGVVTIPGVEQLLVALEQFKNGVPKTGAEESFYYPLSQLWVEESNEFNVIENDFMQEALEACTRFTDSEDQNEILKILENICCGLNDLARFGVLRPKHGSTELEHLAAWIDVDNGFKSMDTTDISEKEQPFTVCPIVFWRPRMSRYKVPGAYALRNKFRDPDRVLS